MIDDARLLRVWRRTHDGLLKLPSESRRLRDVPADEVEDVLGLSVDELRQLGISPFLKRFGADDPGELVVKVPAQLCGLGADYSRV